ncbi:MAG: 5-formyltetrahydrofolate cyclo-ligase [Candidatus Korarchaeota archaeon]|nr:5-formyltetrahydrofolate cyclo-ligase [Candidatus Korarchaeota archaeon]
MARGGTSRVWYSIGGLVRLSVDEKASLREWIWRILEERGVARFPRPIRGRIPNFEGAERAAENLRNLPEYREARVIFCNPDSPQAPVRRMALADGKVVVMATPRLRRGFLVLDPREIPPSELRRAATIRGAFRYGRPVDPWSVSVDMKVVGSVAVSPDGSRLGKGHGYSDLEFAILSEVGAVTQDTPVVTTVHDLQVVDRVLSSDHDVPVDVIVTPTRVIRAPKRKKPSRIEWELLSEGALRDMPILRDIREKRGARSP